MTRSLVIDCDCGTDDAWALLILIKGEEFKTAGPTGNGYKILAITTVHGNSTIDNCTKNTLRLLEATGRLDISVYKGCAKAIMQSDAIHDFISGFNGFGDMAFERSVDLNLVQPEHAVNAMYNLVCLSPNTVDFILVGPLTNFGMCISMYGDDFLNKIGHVYIMGGNYLGKGNITKSAEFNFLRDPEAANIVLEGIKENLVILPWESCLETQLTQQWRFKELGVAENKAVQLLNRIERKIAKDKDFINWVSSGAMLAAAYVFPELIITSSRSYNVTVELTGAHTRGQMVLDHKRLKEDNAEIIVKISKHHYCNALLWSAGLIDMHPNNQCSDEDL